MKRWRLRALVTVLAVAAAGTFTGTPATAAPILDISSISFDRTTVDVTQQPESVYLSWTVIDRDARARRINGVVELRQFTGDTPIGQPRTVSYDFEPGRAQVGGSGTPQESSYVYEFVVPRYAPAAATEWRVTKVTIADDTAHARTVRDPGPATMAVTQLVDSEAPAVQRVAFDDGQPRGFYDDGSGVTLRYRVQITDETALKNGKLTIAGPGGRRASATFKLTQTAPYWYCNGAQTYTPALADCPVGVTVPSGSPSGSWRVTRVELTDSWGHTRVDTAPEGAAPVHVSRNDVVSATSFALTEPQVNNWRRPTTTALTFTPHGLVDGLASVDVDVSSCSPQTRTPEVRADGTVAIELLVPTGSADTCTIDGVKLTDGAGNVAFYGTAYGNANLSLTVTPLPDEKAPVVLGASLPKATWTSQETEDAWGVNFDVTVEVDDFAPVAQYDATLYDSTGASRGSMYGGVQEDNGTLHLAVSTDRLEPGQYTIGITLIDLARNTSRWGYPGNSSTPLPDGPLTLTVVAD
ncbi:hypothetical protein [Actinoplanes auranticolor]|uniref:Ig-like domain-containing protein n=1 Tax=Actinoplanes auranticolor TaxID=47988 RepID=A0A919VT35_9ACTN|nr:hypothetical protein [Actinoplanes auranticolor]GIM77844.1 hypothetical protein Aau02nite_77940 [Actinoplanes auranticolor]